MKNVLGLIIAMSLALVAALLNWQYLERKSQEIEMVSFLAVDEDTRIKIGETFLESHFVQVDVPRKSVGNLEEVAIKWDARQTVIGMKAVQRYEGGEIILRQDLKTPQPTLLLKEDERAMWIPVDSGSFVPALVQPGDFVSFIVQKNVVTGQGNAIPASGVGTTEIIGPFRILSLGGRLGSKAISRAVGSGSTQENVMGIAVKTETNEGKEQLEPKAKKLFDRLQQTNFRKVGVLLHPRKNVTRTRS